MASTTFIDRATNIQASWLNAVNTAVYVDTINLKRAGCVGNGVVDDTAALLAAIASNRKIEGNPGDVYRITSPLVKSNIQNMCLDLKGAKIQLDIGATVPNAGQAHILRIFSTPTFGLAKNITITSSILGGSLEVKNAPSVRKDNNFGIALDGIDGIIISNIEINKSWSAGIWISRSNNVLVTNNYVHDTKADGIMVQACGTNVLYLKNRALNTGDDSFSLTWFTGDDPTYVGLTDGIKRTRSVVFADNYTLNSQARGIFWGGVQGGTIESNHIEGSNSVGILLPRDTVNVSSVFYNPNGVNNSNDDVDIHSNTILNASVGSNSAAAEVGGIWNTEYNTNIRIRSNYLKGCNNVSIVSNGNAEITDNISDSPVLVAGGTVPLSSMAYKGAHFATADFSATNTCYGKIERNTMKGGPFRAVTLNTGYNPISWTVKDNKLIDVGNLSGVSDSISMVSLIRSVNLNNAIITNNSVTETRGGMLVNFLVSVNGNSNTEVKNNRGISVASGLGTELDISSASVNTQSIIRASSVQSAFVLGIGARANFNVTVTGATFGMKAEFAPPGDSQGADINAVVSAANTVNVRIANNTGGGITVAAGTWQITAGG